MFGFFKKKDDIIKDLIKVEPQQPVFRREKPQNTVKGGNQMAIDDGSPVVGRGMVIKDKFGLKGQSVLVIGTAEGSIRKGDHAVITHSDNTMTKTTIKQIEANRKIVDEVLAGEECGLKLGGITKDSLSVNDRIDIVLDEVAETNTAETNMAGMMIVEDVFTIAGRGTVVTGMVETGSFHIGDKVVITRVGGDSYTSEISGIEAFAHSLDMVEAGDNCGLLLKSVMRDDIDRGDRVEVL